MNARKALAAAPVLFATLFAGSLAHANLISDEMAACRNLKAGDACGVEGRKGVCKTEYSEFKKRDFIVCDLNAKPSEPTPVTPTTMPSSTTPSATPSAKDDASKSSTPPSSSNGCGVSNGVDGSLGFGFGAIVGGVAVALLAVRRRRAH